MKNTMIVAAFPGSGKTWLCRHQEQYNGITMIDADYFGYEKKVGWADTYIDNVEFMTGKVDFIFVAMYPEVLQKLHKRGIPFVTVSPNNGEWLPEKARALTKQQWMGRICLRDNATVPNFDSWLKMLVQQYDKWTGIGFIQSWEPSSIILLNEDQYLSDVMMGLYLRKEHLELADYGEQGILDDAEDPCSDAADAKPVDDREWNAVPCGPGFRYGQAAMDIPGDRDVDGNGITVMPGDTNTAEVTGMNLAIGKGEMPDGTRESQDIPEADTGYGLI